MATKQNLIDLVYWRIKRTSPVTYERLVIEQAMARAWNQLLHDTFGKNLTFLDFYAKEYTTQTVSQDATTKQYYVTLPEAIVQLPDRGEGVRSVVPADQDFSTPSGTGVSYVPISNFDMRVKRNTDVGKAESDVVGYSVHFDKIWFDENMTATKASAKVHLKLVIPFDAYASTDEVPVPSGKDEALVQMTMQFLLGSTDIREE